VYVTERGERRRARLCYFDESSVGEYNKRRHFFGAGDLATARAKRFEQPLLIRLKWYAVVCRKRTIATSSFSRACLDGGWSAVNDTEAVVASLAF
jgi:hypothetical protein